jgi:hypothetical protein
MMALIASKKEINGSCASTKDSAHLRKAHESRDNLILANCDTWSKIHCH